MVVAQEPLQGVSDIHMQGTHCGGRVTGCPDFAGICLVFISTSGLLCVLVEKILPSG